MNWSMNFIYTIPSIDNDNDNDNDFPPYARYGFPPINRSLIFQLLEPIIWYPKFPCSERSFPPGKMTSDVVFGHLINESTFVCTEDGLEGKEFPVSNILCWQICPIGDF